jgi:hypothetical protein
MADQFGNTVVSGTTATTPITTPPVPKAAAKPAPPKAAAKPAPPKYLVIALPPHADDANAALVAAAAKGYTTILSVYTISQPSSASTAFAVLSV